MARMYFLFLTVAMVLGRCSDRRVPEIPRNGHTPEEVAVSSDTARTGPVFLPDTCFPSVSALKYEIEHADSADYSLKDLEDRYAGSPHIMTFRRNPLRNADFNGVLNGTPDSIRIEWVFTTANDTTLTYYGRWGGGTGWTGQPLYMKWSEAEAQAFRNSSPALTPHFCNEELFIASLCGEGYFLNFHTGKPSRQSINLGQVVKGTPSLDPELHNLYVGHGVPKSKETFGCRTFDLDCHEWTFEMGRDPKAWRGWNAFDSSPVVAGGYLFWPAENGSLYKFERKQGTLRKVSTMRYKARGAAPGIESSICIYMNYGYFSDNHGNIIALNLNNMKPVWHYANHDDSDATLVCREEDGIPYLYTACEVDRQGMDGWCHMVKINGLNGEPVWQFNIHCRRAVLPNKVLDGGMYATLLLGKGDCSGLLFAHICRNEEQGPKGELVAIDTGNGQQVYSVPYSQFAWSSPIGLMGEQDKMFVFACDATGTVRLLQGATGEVICKKHIDHNFESSPIAVGNAVVVGARNRKIYKFVIE